MNAECFLYQQLITPENFASIYRDTLCFIAALIFLAIFWKPLNSLFQRISENENKWFGKTKFISPDLESTKSKFQIPASTEINVAAAVPTPVTQIPYYKSAHFYWLGSDLMQAIQSLAFYAKREEVIGALRQSLRHFRKAGLADQEIEGRLTWLIDLNEKTVLSEWQKDQTRKDILNEIVIVRQKICTLVEQKAGPEFKPWED